MPNFSSIYVFKTSSIHLLHKLLYRVPAYSLAGSAPVPTDADLMLPLPDLPQSEATVDGMAELNLSEDVTTSKA